MERGAVAWWVRVVLAAGLTGLAVTAVAAPAALAEENPWVTPLRLADAALARKQYTAALRALQDAHGAALGARRWEGMVAVGDGYRRMGEVTGLRNTFDAKAREAYLVALTRARQEGSVDGALQVAESFAVLGDGEMAVQCVRVAQRLAARDAEAQATVRAFATRLADPTLTVQDLRR